VIAGYYGTWASKIAEAGAEVYYSDISRPMVRYARKKYGCLFRDYICSNYEFMPKHAREYDWTFTFEACGGSQGLPIAYMRSLMNNKGGIIVLFWNEKEPERMGESQRLTPELQQSFQQSMDAGAG